MHFREQLRDYTRGLMRQAHEKGTPVMRPLFYEFPADPRSWDVETQYMFGDRYLCCPVMEPGKRKATVYLPAGGTWKALEGGEGEGKGDR